MSMEEWRDIEGFDGYQVSNEGRVRNCKRNTILKPLSDGRGYLQIHLWKNGKSTNKRIHRLVAQAFLENPQNLPEVNHKDENKSSNIVENLEWCDRKYNMNYGTAIQRQSEKL